MENNLEEAIDLLRKKLDFMMDHEKDKGKIIELSEELDVLIGKYMELESENN